VLSLEGQIGCENESLNKHFSFVIAADAIPTHFPLVGIKLPNMLQPQGNFTKNTHKKV